VALGDKIIKDKKPNERGVKANSVIKFRQDILIKINRLFIKFLNAIYGTPVDYTPVVVNPDLTNDEELQKLYAEDAESAIGLNALAKMNDAIVPDAEPMDVAIASSGLVANKRPRENDALGAGDILIDGEVHIFCNVILF
jgi:hypothetical protein